MPETADAPATGAVAGATPAQTTPVSPAADAKTDPATPATGEPDGLGDAGKRAIDAMKAERDAARREAAEAKRRADELEDANKTEHEKEVAEAKKAGAAEVLDRVHGQVRRSEVRAALLAAGVQPGLVDLASRADQFASLKVTDDGVEGLDGAVEAFRKATPELFAKPKATPGDAGLGPRGTPAAGGTDLNTFIRREAGRA